jgi:hypothetical protein
MSSSIPAPTAVNEETETHSLLTVAQIDRLRAVRPGRDALRGEKSCMVRGDVAVPLCLLL